MLSVQTKLQAIYTALASIEGLSVYHYTAPSRATLPYLVWYEDSEDESLDADNAKQEQAIMGYVDYFTKTEFDTMFDTIQTTLNGIENLSWEYEATVYGDPSNDDNNTIHHVWTWKVR